MNTTLSDVLRRAALTALCTSAVVGLTACGLATGAGVGDDSAAKLEDRSGSTIANQAVKTTKGARSLTVTADFTTADGPEKYRMSSNTDGDCAGTLAIDGGNAQLIKTGKTVYLKYDDAFWDSQGVDGKAAAELIGDRWLRSTADSSDVKEIAGLCDLDSTLDGLEQGSIDVTKGKPTTIAGTPAIPLTEKDGKETYTSYVATEGKPYLLKVVVKGGKEPGTVTFSDFDKPLPAKAPAKKDTVSLDELG